MAPVMTARPQIVTNVSKLIDQSQAQAFYSPSEDTSPLSAEEDEIVIALHDFIPVTPNATCLSFRAGQVIRVLNKDATGWWDGELIAVNVSPGTDVVGRGWFPSNYVTTDTSSLPKDSSSRDSTASSWTARQSTTMASISTPITSPAVSSPSSARDVIPVVLHPLLHGLSLLQTAVQQSHAAHYQPSAACIISCVRTILTEAKCLQKDAPLLRSHSELAQARKLLLADLAELVQHAQRAASLARGEDDWEDIGDNEEELLEGMLRTAGLVFTATRKFLVLLDKYGAALPAWKANGEFIRGHAMNASSDSKDSEWSGRHSRNSSDASTSSRDSFEDAMKRSRESMDSPTSPNSAGSYEGAIALGSPSQDDITVNAQRNRDPGFSRVKSMSDLRKKRPPSNYSNSTPKANNTPRHSRYPTVQSVDTSTLLQPRAESTKSHRPSLSLNSRHNKGALSSSSESSLGSFHSPPTPPFPSGPCPSEQVLSTLRITQDHLLSTVAAFIGHIHNHSRGAHSTSKGNIISLATETVERVKTMLAIVDSVLKNDDVIECVAEHKLSALSNAKYNLFVLTNDMVNFVRTITAPSSVVMSEEGEEEEKSRTLNTATGVLRAGRECFYSVNVVLARAAGERGFSIVLPENLSAIVKDSQRDSLSGLDNPISAGPSMDFGDDLEDGEAEATFTRASVARMSRLIQASALIREPSQSTTDEGDYVNDDSLASFDSSEADDDDEPASLTPAGGEVSPVVIDPPASVRTSHSDEDAKTWDAKERPVSALEEKMLRGDLPPAPKTPPANRVIAASLANQLEALIQQPAQAPQDTMYNNEGILVGATLKILVEKMTPEDAVTDASFSSVFFLTFRFFASPPELLDELLSRFNYWPPELTEEEELRQWSATKGFAIRVRVSNFLKSWLENFWRADTDNDVLPRLMEFSRSELAQHLAGPAKRIQDLVVTRMTRMESALNGSGGPVKMQDRLKELNPVSPVSPSDIPRPQITKSLFNQLRHGDFASINVTDFDPLELARQITILESNLYRMVQPHELLEVGRSGAAPQANVKAISSLSTAITGWVTESILSEADAKKRAALLKYFIKVAERCARMNNFSTPWSIMAALNSATIARLSQTWAALQQKQKVAFEGLRKLADHSRNYAEYRSRLRNTAAPAVPFLGLYLTDITFCHEGIPSHRSPPSHPEQRLINFNKYHKLARIVQDMQRFQTTYVLKEISEVQQYLKFQLDTSKSASDLQDLYRRSLFVEPRQPADIPPISGEVRQLFGWAARNAPSQQQQAIPLPS